MYRPLLLRALTVAAELFIVIDLRKVKILSWKILENFVLSPVIFFNVYRSGILHKNKSKPTFRKILKISLSMYKPLQI